jgi:hypothetical protein
MSLRVALTCSDCRQGWLGVAACRCLLAPTLAPAQIELMLSIHDLKPGQPPRVEDAVDAE